METANFQLDPALSLGFSYQQYVASVRALALTHPDEYFAMRRDVLEAVRTDAVGNLYKSLFMVLTKGKSFDDKQLTYGPPAPITGTKTPVAKFGTGVYIPNYPPQKVNDFAMAVASDLADHINRAIDIILPDNFEQLASNNMRLTGMAKSINIPPATAPGV